ncbi:DUF5671 domain-containing protein [Chloroflexota bacterium]
MKTVRRIYIYVVALVSLEVVAWAVIGLGRTLFAKKVIGGSVEQLAGAISLVLVGVPVFLVHWWLAQRDASREPEEHFSGVRALFLYAASLSLGIPIIQNLMAILARALALLLELNPFDLFIGGDQSWSDNLVAVAVNALLLVYIHYVLRADWAAGPQGDGFSNFRRAWRYVWMLYSLVMACAGVQQLLHYILALVDAIGKRGGSILMDGLTLLLVGVPLWVAAWRHIQATLGDPAERRSILRMIVMYAVTFIGVVTALFASGAVLSELLYLAFSAFEKSSGWLNRIVGPLSVALPAVVVWVFYSRVLHAEVDALPDEPRRAAMRRLYAYVLSFLGLGAAFVGLMFLVSLVIELAFDTGMVWGEWVQRDMAAALAALLVGLPVWLRQWAPMNREAAGQDQAGDHSRRSVIRKSYLYLALFAGVMGVMLTAGDFFFQVLRQLLGDTVDNFTLEVVRSIAFLVLFAVLTLYHWRALRGDGQRATRLLAELHAAFSVAIFETHEGDFTSSVLAALKSEAPEIPVAIQTVGEPLDESLAGAGAVILPAELAANPPEAIRIWLDEFGGVRLVVTLEAPGWVWVGAGETRPEALARQAAKAAGQLAEGQSGRAASRSIWVTLGYIFTALAVLAALCVLTSLLGEIF